MPIMTDMLTLVLGLEVKTFKVNKNMIEYNSGKSINLYEFIHLCKEFIKQSGYCVELLLRDNGLVTLELSYGIDYDYTKTFNAKKGIHCDRDTEATVVFLALQWIIAK